MEAQKSILTVDSTPDSSVSPRALNPRLILRVSEYRLLLVGLDLFAVNTALLVSLSLRSGFGLHWQILTNHPLWFALMSALWLLLANAFDAYELGVADRLLASIRAVVGAGTLAMLLYLFIPYFTPPLPTSSLAALSLPLLAVIALLGGRALCMLVLPRPAFQRRVLIIGTGQSSRTVAQALYTNSCSSYQIVGFISRVFPEGQEVAITLDGQEGAADGGGRAPLRLPILGDSRIITEVAERYKVTTMVLDTPRDMDSDLLRSLTDCVERGIEVTSASALHEQLTGRVPVEHEGKHWYVDLPVGNAGISPLWTLAKRVMDVLFATLGLLCLGLILPFVVLAICLDSPGPIFYSQKRIGKGGKVFQILKFRSMVPEAEHGEALWAQQNDGRITRVGRILRATHLDEFPQFLNVLSGDMSAVGPRPERPELIRELTVQIPPYRLRHAIKPGMAGWALVKRGYVRTNHGALLRLQYDLYYIKHQSLWLDTVIILKTIGRAVAFKGR